MIRRHEMLPILVHACPSFAQKWEDHKKLYRDQEDFLPYAALAEFDYHLVELYKRNESDVFGKIFAEVERFHVEGEAYVNEAATIGFIEGLQNVASNNGLDPEVFFKYLGPISAKRWVKVNRFWNGEIELIPEKCD